MLRIVAYQRFSKDNIGEAFLIVWGKRIAIQIKKVVRVYFRNHWFKCFCYLYVFWVIKEKNNLKWLESFKFASIIPISVEI